MIETAIRALVGAVLALAGAPPSPPERYVALGDSYSSGTGARTYDLDSSCQRSRYSYPPLVAQRRPRLELVFAACSGATTDDVLLTQVRHLDDATRLVTITIGANDFGLIGVVGTCLQSPADCTRAIQRGRSDIRQTLPAKLDALYAQIRRRAPRARVIVLGYPRLFDNARCASIASAHVAQLNRGADLLRDVIRARVQAAGRGFEFADAIPAFAGHGICAREPWINGLTDPIVESYHLARVGYSRGYAPLVLRAVR